MLGSKSRIKSLSAACDHSNCLSQAVCPHAVSLTRATSASAITCPLPSHAPGRHQQWCTRCLASICLQCIVAQLSKQTCRGPPYSTELDCFRFEFRVTMEDSSQSEKRMKARKRRKKKKGELHIKLLICFAPNNENAGTSTVQYVKRCERASPDQSSFHACTLYAVPNTLPARPFCNFTSPLQLPACLSILMHCLSAGMIAESVSMPCLVVQARKPGYALVFHALAGWL